jgi:hypothetical protein
MSTPEGLSTQLEIPEVIIGASLLTGMPLRITPINPGKIPGKGESTRI